MWRNKRLAFDQRDFDDYVKTAKKEVAAENKKIDARWTEQRQRLVARVATVEDVENLITNRTNQMRTCPLRCTICGDDSGTMIPKELEDELNWAFKFLRCIDYVDYVTYVDKGETATKKKRI